MSNDTAKHQPIMHEIIVGAVAVNNAVPRTGKWAELKYQK